MDMNSESWGSNFDCRQIISSLWTFVSLAVKSQWVDSKLSFYLHTNSPKKGTGFRFNRLIESYGNLMYDLPCVITYYNYSL